MRIATFNLESLDIEPGQEALLDVRCAVLRPQLQRLAADVLCLQEVNGQRVKGEPGRVLKALERLLDGTPYAGYHRASTTGPLGVPADVHNLVTLSRWPFLEQRQIRHALVPPLRTRLLNACPPAASVEEFGFERPVLLVSLKDAGGVTWSIFNVHLRAPIATAIPGQKQAPFMWKSVSGWAEGFWLSDAKRVMQALEIRMCVDGLLDDDPERHIVIAGDFNAREYETPMKILAGAEEDTGNGALAARALALVDRAVPQDRRFSVLHHGRPEMLDHIFASRTALGLFRSIEVHNETLADEAIGSGKSWHPAASYHAPVVALFGEGPPA